MLDIFRRLFHPNLFLITGIGIVTFGISTFFWELPFCQSLRSQLSHTQIQLTSLESELANYESELNNLKNQIAEKDLQISNMGIELKDAQDRVEDLENQLVANNTQVSDLETQLKGANDRITELDTQLSNKNIEADFITTQLEDAVEKNDELQKAIESIDTNISMQNLMNGWLQAELEEGPVEFEWQWAGENWFGKVTLDNSAGTYEISNAKIVSIEKGEPGDANKIWVNGDVLYHEPLANNTFTVVDSGLMINMTVSKQNRYTGEIRLETISTTDEPLEPRLCFAGTVSYQNDIDGRSRGDMVLVNYNSSVGDDVIQWLLRPPEAVEWLYPEP